MGSSNIHTTVESKAPDAVRKRIHQIAIFKCDLNYQDVKLTNK
jgi:hypothetical protein